MPRGIGRMLTTTTTGWSRSSVVSPSGMAPPPLPDLAHPRGPVPVLPLLRALAADPAPPWLRGEGWPRSARREEKRARTSRSGRMPSSVTPPSTSAGSATGKPLTTTTSRWTGRCCLGGSARRFVRELPRPPARHYSSKRPARRPSAGDARQLHRPRAWPAPWQWPQRRAHRGPRPRLTEEEKKRNHIASE
jgi:hypothetical protein